MGDIYLVRHGQASFGADDYDNLSARGEEQCHRLGQHMKGFIKPEVMLSGQHRRHRQSLASFCEGADFNPNKENELADFNEFDHEQVLFKAFPHLVTKQDIALELASLPDPRKRFHQMFQQSVERWISGNHDQEYSESWQTFQVRCIQGLTTCIEQYASKGPIMVFTSGGPVAAITQHVLGLTDKATFELNENLVNSGVTRLRFNKNRASLSYLNSFGHLEQQPNLITYR